MKTFALFNLCILLVGCASAPNSAPQGAVGSPEWLAQRTNREREVYYSELCAGQGNVPGSEEFFNCVVEIDQDYRFGIIRTDFMSRAR